MHITVELPDDLLHSPDPARAALEAFVIEGYRSGALSDGQAGSLLGMSRLGFEAFLKQRGIMDHAYGVDQLGRDWTNVEKETQKRLEQFTDWLRDCPDAGGLSIHPTNDRGPFPYQWKVSTGDSSRHLGYVLMHGPIIGTSDREKNQFLCERLREVLRGQGT